MGGGPAYDELRALSGDSLPPRSPARPRQGHSPALAPTPPLAPAPAASCRLPGEVSLMLREIGGFRSHLPKACPWPNYCNKQGQGLITR